MSKIKIILIISILSAIIGYVVFNAFYKNEISVERKMSCNDMEEILSKETFIVKNKTVFVKLQSLNQNGKVDNDGVGLISELEDCVVVDNKNWTCGGKTDFNRDVTDEIFSVVNGKFGYAPQRNGFSSDCVYEYKQLN